VLICYEIIFPELARRCVEQGASFLVTITNDAWFGRTGAPYQHNSMAAFRAIENRVFVARAANTGITSVIDPAGKIICATEIFTPDVITGKITLIKIPTLYNRYGDIFVLVCAIVSILFLGGCLLRRY
jgi:apolipoprotein N-acyltransferase